MSTTLFSILTTRLRTIFSTEEIPCASCRMLLSLLEQEKALNRDLLGLSAPTAPTLPTQSWPRSDEPGPQEPSDPLEGLPESAKEALTREYAEHLSRFPKNMTVHPQVEQIIPGNPNVSSTP
jgi:hypothetical protein